MKKSSIIFSIDTTKIPESELNKVMDIIEKLGKAKAELFQLRFRKKSGRSLLNLKFNTKFEGETEVVL